MKRVRGQSLAEYALILALVAIITIAILGVAGLAIQRVYGLVYGALGGKREVQTTQHFIYFDPSWLPTCQYVSGLGTGLYTEFYTDIPMTDVTVSTDKGFVLTFSLDTPPYHYKANPTLTSANDLSVCPRSLVIQSSKNYGGVITVAPVTGVP